MITSGDPAALAADLSKMTAEPVSVDRAEEILSEQMAWLPQGEPLQSVAEDRTASAGDGRSVRRRTIVFRRAGDQLQIIVEISLLAQGGIEMERRRFEEFLGGGRPVCGRTARAVRRGLNSSRPPKLGASPAFSSGKTEEASP